MHITENCQNDIAIFKIKGRLDNEGSDIFREHLLRRIEEASLLKLVIDFTETSYIASMGIRALFIPARELSGRGGKIVLCGLSKDIKAVLSVGGVLSLFSAYETAEEAVRKNGW